MLVYKNQTDKAKGAAVKSFLRYMLTDGQKLANDVDYATLPTGFQAKALAQIDSITLPTT
jgi:phosphate transport system substrate-binding protein